ncbi:hypothetical protein GGI11_005794 [Coemansia sp. RSA 2049]|nr:hypothetical protein H4217_008630 [Coemansia sp. RSA 1939]KAJ2509633.1 hypothetical protein GGI11_005794 [Coemansia sp. RSA 2049]KAJ2616910.1 hypothetical protein EV177_000819 [Coemansia sp. RSA 1804]KAJ2674790.1 hypothetical protein GGH99_005956 [Coemansia sp. RSA 1285]
MQAVFRLILEGLAMFAGSWAAGCVPLYVKMSSSKFNLLALFGAGLLIGAALAVILPEGVETMTRAVLARHPGSAEGLADAVNSAVGWSLVAGFCVMFLVDNLFSSHAHGPAAAGGAMGADAGDGAGATNDSGTCLEEIPMTHQSPAAHGARGESDYTLNGGADASRAASDSMTTLNIDHQHRASHSPAAAMDAAAQKPQWRCVLQKLARAVSPWSLPSTLLGILVHSCADGLALGAAVAAAAVSEASSSPHAGGSSSLEIIVFFALLLHKAPAAFGLITTLKQQGFAHYKLSVWLTMFAASAPLAALATFAVFLLATPSPSPRAAKEAGAVQPWTGIVMLFSAGTFMYVAMAHTLAEAVAQAKALRAKAAGNSRMAKLAFLDIAVLLLGIILPPLVSKDHDG